MRITVNRKELVNALKVIKQIIPKGLRPHIPILQCVKIESQPHSVLITGTDLETGVVARLPATIAGAGAVVVNMAMLLSNIDSLKDDNIIIEDEKSMVVLKVKGSTVTLTGEKTEEYPPVARRCGKPLAVFNLPATLLRCSYALATDDTRPVLTGACFTLKDKGLEIACADGFRLGVANTILGAPVRKGIPTRFIVPGSAVRLMERFKEDECTMSFTIVTPKPDAIVKDAFIERIEFVFGAIAVYTNAIQGTYPNYPQLFPKETTSGIYFKRDVMFEAVKAFKSTKDAHILRIQPMANKIRLSMVDGEGIGISSEIKGHATLKTAFNIGYFRNMLQVLTADTVKLEGTNDKSPVVVAEKNAKHALMPMCVTW